MVIAAKNEAPNLPQLVDEVTAALRPLCNDSLHGLSWFEIIVVDDASTDETGSVLSSLAEAYPELRGLMLAHSVGQSAATMAGIHAARGNWVATLDADLQNDPADLVRLWNALPGYDAVLGWRVTRQDICSKRVISGWANRVRNMILGQSIRDTGCSVRIFPTAMALRLPAFHGMHRFFGPLLLREGCTLDSGASQPSTPPIRSVALQSLESITRRDCRPVRCRLADAPAGSLSRDPDVPIVARFQRL